MEMEASREVLIVATDKDHDAPPSLLEDLPPDVRVTRCFSYEAACCLLKSRRNIHTVLVVITAVASPSGFAVSDVISAPEVAIAALSRGIPVIVNAAREGDLRNQPAEAHHWGGYSLSHSRLLS